MRFLFSSVALMVAVPLVAHAQSTSRAARVLSLSGDSVGVLVAGNRVYVPEAGSSALSACTDRRCAAVASVESCTVPRCPGTGTMLRLEAPIAAVSDLPTDREGWNRAIEAMRADPALGMIAPFFGTHPDPPPEPARWVTASRRDRISWEAGGYVLAGALAATGVPLFGGEASIGLRFLWEPHGDDDDFLALLLGDVLGLDVRVRAFDIAQLQGPSEWGVLVGLAPAVGYATRSETFRLPTFYSIIIPEVGVALRANRDAAWYAGWSLPVAFLLSSGLGVEARASVMLIDDWIPGDDVEALVSLSLGLVVR